MKLCKKCKQELTETDEFCPHCGAPVPPPDPYDHTPEFDAQDVSKHKPYAMAIYLLGFLGVLLAHLVKEPSPYLEFHKRQGLYMVLADVLLICIILLLCWTIILPVAAGVMLGVFVVLHFVCFVQVCMGQSKEVLILRSIKFLK